MLKNLLIISLTAGLWFTAITTDRKAIIAHELITVPAHGRIWTSCRILADKYNKSVEEILFYLEKDGQRSKTPLKSGQVLNVYIRED